MDTDIVIDVQHLSKAYKLYNKPIDRLKETLHPLKRVYHRDFYALRDVSFQVKRGETVGIIGKNGAGKSTLLKLITGVLTPNSGSVTVNGKISSLLELGTGFNPEFTGIENIYLNGTIMGYTKEEIDDRLPAILEFADIGDFVYQPVKIYSSGMYVRLAFSVAINVEPEVLIVDEALAVGDARFQLKCFRRLEEIRKLGTTILLVTHDLATTKKICTHSILLNDGTILCDGDPKEVAIAYNRLLFPNDDEQENIVTESTEENDKEKSQPENSIRNGIRIGPSVNAVNTFGMGGADFEYLEIHNVENFQLGGGEKIIIDVHFHYDWDSLENLAFEQKVDANLIVGVSFSDIQGTYLFGMTTYDKGILLSDLNGDGNEGFIRFLFPMPCLQNGEYFLNCAIALGTQENHVQLRWHDGIASFRMVSNKKYVYGLMYQEYEVQKR